MSSETNNKKLDVDLLEHFRQLYQDEIAHTERLSSKIVTHLTIIIANGGIIAFFLLQFVQDMKTFIPKFYSYLSIFSIVICCSEYLLSILFFYRSFSGYGYKYIPLSELPDYYTRLSSSTASDSEKKEHILSMFARKYLAASTHNREENRKRSLQLRLLTCASTRTFVCEVCTFIIYLLYVTSAN